MKLIKQVPSFLLFLSLIITVPFFSCHKTDNVQLPAKLSVDSTSLSLKFSDNTVDSFTISSNISWTVSIAPSNVTWIKTNVTSGTGNGKIIVTVLKDNISTADQSATININPAGNTSVKPLSIVINQSHSVPVLKVDSATLTLGAETTSLDSFDVSSNINWSISVSPSSASSWLKTSVTSGSNNGMVKLSVIQQNNSTSSQSATVTVSPVNNSSVQPVTVTVNQKQLNVTKVFYRAYGGTNSDILSTVIKAPDGGYIMVGSTLSTDGDITGNHGNYDIMVVKTSADGTKQWVKTIGGSGMDLGNSIALASDGGYVVAGYTESNNSGDIPASSGTAAVVLKLNSAGTLQWVKTFGNNMKQVNAIANATDGGYAIANSVFNGNDDDIFVLKINSDGTQAWTKTLGGSQNDDVASIVGTSDGGFAIAGSTQSSATGDMPASKGGWDGFVLKLGSDGSKQWINNYGGTKDDELYGIAATTDGFVACGTTYSTDGDVTQNKGSSDALIIRINNDGSKRWVQTFGGSSTEQFSSAAFTPDGGIIAAGITYTWSSGMDGDIPPINGYTDGLVVKISPDGTKQWVRVYGGSSIDYFTAATVGSDGNYVFAGSTTSVDGDLPQQYQTFHVSDAFIFGLKEQ